MPDDAALILCKPHLRTLDAIVLVITADFFDTFVKDDEVLNQVDKALFIKHRINLAQELIAELGAFLINADICITTLVLMVVETIGFPFQIELFLCQQSTVAQTFSFVACHAELHCGEKRLNKAIFLVGEILTNSGRD